MAGFFYKYGHRDEKAAAQTAPEDSLEFRGWSSSLEFEAEVLSLKFRLNLESEVSSLELEFKVYRLWLSAVQCGKALPTDSASLDLRLCSVLRRPTLSEKCHLFSEIKT